MKNCLADINFLLLLEAKALVPDFLKYFWLTSKIVYSQGEGPVHLIGSHCIDFFASMDGEGDTEDEDDEMEVCSVVLAIGVKCSSIVKW